MINTFTCAPVLAPMWGGDPLSQEALAERRAHLHWLADALIAGLLPPRSATAAAPG